MSLALEFLHLQSLKLKNGCRCYKKQPNKNLAWEGNICKGNHKNQKIYVEIII